MMELIEDKEEKQEELDLGPSTPPRSPRRRLSLSPVAARAAVAGPPAIQRRREQRRRRPSFTPLPQADRIMSGPQLKQILHEAIVWSNDILPTLPTADQVDLVLIQCSTGSGGAGLTLRYRVSSQSWSVTNVDEQKIDTQQQLNVRDVINKLLAVPTAQITLGETSIYIKATQIEPIPFCSFTLPTNSPKYVRLALQTVGLFLDHPEYCCHDQQLLGSFMMNNRHLTLSWPLMKWYASKLQDMFPDLHSHSFPDWYSQNCRNGLVEQPQNGLSTSELVSQRGGLPIPIEEEAKLKEEGSLAPDYTDADLPLMRDPITKECWKVTDLLQLWNAAFHRWPIIPLRWPTSRRPFTGPEILTLLYLALQANLPLPNIIYNTLLSEAQNSVPVIQLQLTASTLDIYDTQTDLLFVVTKPTTAETVGMWLPESEAHLDQLSYVSYHNDRFRHYFPSTLPPEPTEDEWNALSAEGKQEYENQEQAAYDSLVNSEWFQQATAMKTLQSEEDIQTAFNSWQSEFFTLVDSTYIVYLKQRQYWPPGIWDLLFNSVGSPVYTRAVEFAQAFSVDLLRHYIQEPEVLQFMLSFKTVSSTW
jgi:hypothetical protein